MADDKAIFSGSRGKRGYWICCAAGTLGAIVGILSLYFAHVGWKCRQVEMVYPWLVFWVIGTPVWFWFEYFFIYRRYGDPTAFDSFKHGQQLSLAIWAALAFFLNGLVSAEHFKERHDSNACCESQQPTASCISPALKSDGKPNDAIRSGEARISRPINSKINDVVRKQCLRKIILTFPS